MGSICTKKGAIYGGQTAQVACDFYHRYQEDILLMKSMNIENFRFSLAWTRIIPEGQGTVSQAGIDFYNRIINFCLEQGIVPWVTFIIGICPKF
ncbi:family 1 glycosylhydrolase [Winogradskyella maritima]|nr:family 1 glycosylhydrolase [Winogradskyella maritima]